MKNMFIQTNKSALLLVFLAANVLQISASNNPLSIKSMFKAAFMGALAFAQQPLNPEKPTLHWRAHIHCCDLDARKDSSVCFQSCDAESKDNSRESCIALQSSDFCAEAKYRVLGLGLNCSAELEGLSSLGDTFINDCCGEKTDKKKLLCFFTQPASLNVSAFNIPLHSLTVLAPGRVQPVVRPPIDPLLKNN